MVYEFEGRTEKEAIDRATAELGVEKDTFDVEIVEAQRGGLFKKGFVRINVHVDEPRTAKKNGSSPKARVEEAVIQNQPHFQPEVQNDFERDLISFVENIIKRMGYTGEISVAFRENRKIGFKIDSADSSILIGKKGKNLDALQLLANLYASKLGRGDIRVILDSENYRLRREETLVRLAYTVADRVKETRTSILLEPMNPFDRRLIHTTINDIADIETKSEGEGIYKQVRVFYKGPK
ncbi:MAG: protein jag [Treponema sp.]|jgi:spoIIIJ-associated protein|nr:protein jag [Treponema sp.]